MELFQKALIVLSY